MNIMVNDNNTFINPNVNPLDQLIVIHENHDNDDMIFAIILIMFTLIILR